MQTFRNNGAIGAILDEYEKAIKELQEVIQSINPTELVTIVDKETKDPDCVSIQKILSHVVGSGYTYVIEIRKSLGEQLPYRTPKLWDTVAQYQRELTDMFQYNEQLFVDYPNLKMEEYEPAKKMVVRWGQLYDVEQILEHAIVHILRHRRQIERFLIRLRHS